MKSVRFWIGIGWLGLAACGGKPEDSATRGNVQVAADESFIPILDAERDAFTATYKDVKVNLNYVSEGKAVNLLLGDSVKLILISRELDTTERAELAKSLIKYRSYRLATDAVALISHPGNPDTLISVEQLKGIFNGQIRTWKQLNPQSEVTDSLIVVFDKGNSSNLTYMKKKLDITQEKIPVFAAKTNQNVVEYVKQHRGALGFIGLSWISDRDTPLAMTLRESIRLLWVGKPDSTGKMLYDLPFQSALALKTYPLTRDIICVSREPGTGPATGFLNYMSGDIGQRIILKSGLLPSELPPRFLQLKNRAVGNIK
jgi:phosphate transport system substrate-binding protein